MATSEGCGATKDLLALQEGLFFILNSIGCCCCGPAFCAGCRSAFCRASAVSPERRMLLPFTYAMDPATAMALLLGLGATTTRPIRSRRSCSGARPCGVCRHGDRRLSDDQARRRRPRARGGLYVGADGRPVRRGADGGRPAGRAADSFCSSVRRNFSGSRCSAFRWSPSCRAIRRCAA